MAKGFDLTGKIFTVLKEESGKRMTGREIAEAMQQRFPEACAAKEASSKQTFDHSYPFVSQLVAEIGASRKRLLNKYSSIKTVETRPREFYHTTLSDEAEVVADTTPQQVTETSYAPRPTEHDLYPMLSQFADEEMSCKTLRIDERRSSNQRGAGGNHWLFPDLVGLEDLTEEWGEQMKKLAKVSGGERARTYSFEVKLKINRSNVRECVFQTVSNSSWANQSYLVAAEVDVKALPELRMLCTSHGIGFIRLDTKAPSDSQILIPAAMRPEVDWSQLSRLAEENPDALEYVELTHDFLAVGRLRDRDWGVRK